MSGYATAPDEMVDPEKDHGAQQRHEEAGGLIRTIVTDESPEIGAEEGACDSQQHGDEDATRILAGHDEFRQSANDETDDCNPDEMEHVFSSTRKNTGPAGATFGDGLIVLLDAGSAGMIFVQNFPALRRRGESDEVRGERGRV